MLETRARESTLCNKTLFQLLIIYLSFSFLHIYIKVVHYTFTTFNNQSINEDHYTAAYL